MPAWWEGRNENREEKKGSQASLKTTFAREGEEKACPEVLRTEGRKKGLPGEKIGNLHISDALLEFAEKGREKKGRKRGRSPEDPRKKEKKENNCEKRKEIGSNWPLKLRGKKKKKEKGR